MSSNFTDATTQLRAALNAEAAAVLSFREHSGFDIVASSEEEGFDLRAAVPPVLVDLARRSPGTRARNGVVVAPLSEDRGVLCVVRSHADFTLSEVSNIELVASQLSKTPMAPRARLRRDTIVDAFGLEDASSIAWGESEAEHTEAEVDAPPGPMLAFGALKSTPFISDDGLRDMLGKSVTKLLETTLGHVGAIVLAGNEGFTVLAFGATPKAPDVEARRLISSTIVAQVLESGLPVLTLDANQDDVASRSKSVARLSVSTVMCVPLLANERAAGAIYSATFALSGNFDPKTLSTLMSDAQTVSQMLQGFGQI